MNITFEFLTGQREHEVDRENFRRHGHNPDVAHFVDPGPWVYDCPFQKSPHWHSTSPPERLVEHRHKLWTNEELDEMEFFRVRMKMKNQKAGISGERAQDIWK